MGTGSLLKVLAKNFDVLAGSVFSPFRSPFLLIFFSVFWVPPALLFLAPNMAPAGANALLVGIGLLIYFLLGLKFHLILQE